MYVCTVVLCSGNPSFSTGNRDRNILKFICNTRIDFNLGSRDTVKNVNETWKSARIYVSAIIMFLRLVNWSEVVKNASGDQSDHFEVPFSG